VASNPSSRGIIRSITTISGQEERGFSFSDPNVGVLLQFLALPHEALRRLPQRLRSQPHFGWKLRAP